MNTAHILIIEHDANTARLISNYLTLDGYSSTVIQNGNNALATFQQIMPDLIILDTNLPGKNGLAVCQSVRAISDVPIIMMSASVDEIDHLMGFEAGADDYVCKPFQAKILMARAKAILKRANKVKNEVDQFSDDSTLIKTGNIVLNVLQHRVTINNKEVKLTANEFTILKALLSSPNQVFTRQELLAHTQGKYFENYERTIDSHIKNIRKKLNQADSSYQPINSIYGVGYKYLEQVNSQVNTSKYA